MRPPSLRLKISDDNICNFTKKFIRLQIIMIENIIFDLGNIFIPLHLKRARLNFIRIGLFYIPKNLKDKFLLYEIGKINSKEFILELKKNTYFGNEEKIIKAWNSIIGTFDIKNFEILNWAKKKGYNLFLLSNLNGFHLETIKRNMGKENFKKFEFFFKKIYFSHQIALSKPSEGAYKIILDENQILAKKTLFIDDLKKNINSAKKLGFHTWHFNSKKDSLSQLKNKISNLQKY